MLKLRSSRHPEFVRIVLEGPETVILKGTVTQKGKDISVNFQDSKFSLQDVELPFPYNTVKNSVVFSPGEFKKFKSAFLQSPARLVIDVYQELKAEEVKAITPAKPLKTKTIIIDPGHGGHEYGLIMGSYREKDVVLDIAKTLRTLAGKGSTRCFLTRSGDQFMSLGERADFSNNKKGEIFLSLHIGKHKDIVIYTPVITEPAPAGVEPPGQAGFLAKTLAFKNAMLKAIREDLGSDMVSVKPLPYSILSGIEAAALIIELPSFKDVSYNSDFKRELSNTILKGIYMYEVVTAN
ncbi:MAG: N-acetylmuramoyl-L-alanine amidase [Nitrospirae bacterium]|nr:N-acetylmuramoyl-L-alanine amidase [Nitrospirota bacterium]